MFRSNNVTARVFERQILTPRPGTSINLFRHFYENLCPTHTIYDIDCPDHTFRKFTDDGLFLVAFSRNHQDLIVYRSSWPSYSCSSNNCLCDRDRDRDRDHDHLPPRTAFASFFPHLYTVSLPSPTEFICKDFFLYIVPFRFGIFATSTTQVNDPASAAASSSSSQPPVQGAPSVEKITFYLVRLDDGTVLDKKAFFNDFVNLAHCTGAFLYDDLLSIVSLRYQTVHILQIRESGNLVEVHKIGLYCQEDDELFLHSHAQVSPGSSFLPGIKQRLLSFIFRKTWNEEPDQNMRIQHLKKKFYFHFQDYVDLIIWKVQFLDRHHLLIKFGSVDGVDSILLNKGRQRLLGLGFFVRDEDLLIGRDFLISRSTDQGLSFFAVYNMETTEIISFYQNSSEEMYSFFEQFYDFFNSVSRNALHAQYISSHTNNMHALDQLLNIKNKSPSSLQFVKKMMLTLPYTCQSHSPSPYFDLSLFRYDDKLISAMDRHRHSTEHPIKFISLRQPTMVKFKIKPGAEGGGPDGGRPKKVSSFLFHPYLPLILSIQQTYMQPTVVNLHFRR